MKCRTFFVRSILTIILLMTVTTYSQVFIPFLKGNDQPTLSPSGTIYLLAGSSTQLTASGGMGVYDWSNTGAAQGDGALLSYTPSLDNVVDYDARATSYQNDTITMTTPGYSNITRTVTTFDALDISPTTANLVASATQQFNAIDGYCIGVPGVCTNATASWDITSGGGSISSTGLFTAPGVNDTTVVRVRDSVGNEATATVTTVATLTIAPTSVKIPVYSTVNYSALLGTIPYTYSVASGSGTLGCTTTLNGAHTNTVGTITVASTAGCPSRGVIFVESEQICYTGTTGTTFTGSSFGGTNVLRGCNGTTAAAHANGVTVNLNKKVYTAPSTTGSAVVKVTDNVTASSDSTVTIIKPVNIAKGYAFTCILYDEGSVKCWGENTYGQLGIGTTSSVGDLGTELGGANSFVDLGSGRTATKIVAGVHHACALLDNSTVKCWGRNNSGQLGIGSTTNSTTPALVTFSGGQTPNNLWAYGYNTCAGFTDNTTICWGENTLGQAGQNFSTDQTSPPATALNFGSSRYATKMTGSNTASCALLNDGSIQCWGENTAGSLGYGDTTVRTAPSGTGITLGGILTATDISGYSSSGSGTTSGTTYHHCAVLSDATIKCWGENGRNQLGDTTTTDRTSPTSTSAAGFNASEIYTGREFSCAKSTTGFVKCWGRNTRGQLLVGSTTSMTSPAHCKTTVTGAHTAVVTTITVGSTTNCPTSNGKVVIGTEVICYTGRTGTTFTGATRGCDGTTASAYSGGEAAFGIINWGTGVGFSKMGIGGRSGCMISGSGSTDNDRIKCWGENLNTGVSAQSGLLLYHSTVTGTTTSYIGDAMGELGNNLPFVNH